MIGNIINYVKGVCNSLLDNSLYYSMVLKNEVLNFDSSYPIVYYYTNNSWHREYISNHTMDYYFFKVRDLIEEIFYIIYHYLNPKIEFYKLVYKHNNNDYKITYHDRRTYKMANDIIKELDSSENVTRKKNIVYACGILKDKEDDITNKIIEISGPYHNFYSDYGITYNLNLINKILCKKYEKLKIMDDDCNIYEFIDPDVIVL